jgi:enoyl-CoA hydratase
MGLVNRVVADGDARREAEALALEIAQFPPLCMRNDRLSAIESLGEPISKAMEREFALGLATIASGETAAGAGRFMGGEGRHGVFQETVE